MRTHTELLAIETRPPRHSCQWFYGAGARIRLCADAKRRQSLYIPGEIKDAVVLKVSASCHDNHKTYLPTGSCLCMTVIIPHVMAECGIQ